MKYDLIIPVVQADVSSFLKGINWIFRYLPVKKILLIGSKAVEKSIPTEYKNVISYLDENSIVPYDEVKEIIREVSDNDNDSIKRTGWYLQQFIKMQYAKICKDDFYLVWDSDTYPIKEVKFFDGGKPLFDVKTEYHSAYFDTMQRLLPELSKTCSYSFIAEHMLISCEVMKELIYDIEQSPYVGEIGEIFYKKIIRAVDLKELAWSGFSEFETYGTYCMTKYPDLYEIRPWRSLRTANYYFDIDNFTEKEAHWLDKYYDAVSFEKTISSNNNLKKIYSNKVVQKILSFPKAQYLEGIIKKIMQVTGKKI